jgi:hypothetical protein
MGALNAGSSFLAGLALLGVGRHGLEWRRERLRDRETAEVLAAALHAEICAMRSKVMQLLVLLGRSSGVPDGTYDMGRAIGLAKAIVFERNVRRLGMPPADLARILAEFYGIRSVAKHAGRSALIR